MKRDIVLFGAGRYASMHWYLLAHDSPYRVVAFTADEAFCQGTGLHGLPLVPFESIEQRFPPGDYLMCLAIGYVGLNRLRQEKMARATDKGYTLVSYLSSRALVSPTATVGRNCMIFEGAVLEPFASIGDNCVLRPGSVVQSLAHIAPHCFVATGAVVAPGARVEENCVLGLNSMVGEGVQVAPRCIVGAGAAVLTDTEPDGVYMGVPATRRVRAARGEAGGRLHEVSGRL